MRPGGRDFQGDWDQSGQCQASCCSLERDERMGFGPALFPWVVLLPLFLSFIFPPAPGGCEDLAPADPQSCPTVCPLDPCLDLALALGSLTLKKTLEQEGLHRGSSKLQSFPSIFHLRPPNISALYLHIRSFRIPLPQAFSCTNSLSFESKGSQHCGSRSLWELGESSCGPSRLPWPLDTPVTLLESCPQPFYPLVWARCAPFCSFQACISFLTLHP